MNIYTNVLCYIYTLQDIKTGKDLEQWGLEALDAESSTIYTSQGFHRDNTIEGRFICWRIGG